MVPFPSLRVPFQMADALRFISVLIEASSLSSESNLMKTQKRGSIHIGTSGFQYDEWKGTFYPERLSKAKMLPYYAERFDTTEINYSFRRIPSENTLGNWSAATPAHFLFSLKAPEAITHHAMLRDRKSVV